MKDQTNLEYAKMLQVDFLMELPPETIPWRNKWVIDCQICKLFAESNEQKPACPPNGSIDDFTFVCQHCGRRWMQHIEMYHIWRHVTDKAEWQAIRRQQILKDADLAF